MKDYEYYEKKADNSLKMLSELERFEIFNLESAEKYDNAQNIDFIIDENGYIKYMIVGVNGSKFSFLSSREYVEIPWDCVTKVGANVIVISADETKIRRARA
ncbi:YlmC/YmxH family sporulation protein [Clostridium sp. NSJ-49]|uniref:Sporulation protein YlmC/YmxH n=1 Tax=Clostridium disporicum TaxID=84024 RepID=A0A173Y127_9CLOT|nr:MULTISPECIES: YlmC/YmxH family sporulation protein [Clostridium]MBC5625593.1 YlmC/YmxH family sporulation protein [Clostridium sp. NSJ-49]MCD2501017.1 YlmC/YmxH family sporulation protein [Clostridium sp. NSJ-145]MDU6339745.1 YlmC/YmxH family sporulation protein [Clostridium sp.]CUN57353.1 sporulation protein YlmC/YmxH [Clostridium disporicum]